MCFILRHSPCKARGQLKVESTGTSLLREAETLQPGSFPSAAHPAAQRPPARAWLSEGACHRWTPGPGSSRKGKTRTSMVSAQELLLCGAAERSFPGQGNAATQPLPGARGRSRESRRKLTEPSSARSLCSLVPWLLQPPPCQHWYPGPAATAADSHCHPGPSLLSSVQQRLREGRALPREPPLLLQARLPQLPQRVPSTDSTLQALEALQVGSKAWLTGAMGEGMCLAMLALKGHWGQAAEDASHHPSGPCKLFYKRKVTPTGFSARSRGARGLSRPSAALLSLPSRQTPRSPAITSPRPGSPRRDQRESRARPPPP